MHEFLLDLGLPKYLWSRPLQGPEETFSFVTQIGHFIFLSYCFCYIFHISLLIAFTYFSNSLCITFFIYKLQYLVNNIKIIY
jgi:hypothetical protein